MFTSSRVFSFLASHVTSTLQPAGECQPGEHLHMFQITAEVRAEHVGDSGVMEEAAIFEAVEQYIGTLPGKNLSDLWGSVATHERIAGRILYQFPELHRVTVADNRTVVTCARNNGR